MDKNTQHKHCLNCNTELQGEYCHVCGQKAINKTLTVKEFVLEYLNIAFIWDSKFTKTIWQLLRRPGHVTKEYVSGKFVSYTHPLKLNMFLMFVFITLFLLFYKDLGTSIQSFTRDEIHYPRLQLQMLAGDDEYSKLIEVSPLDTVQLYAPLLLVDAFPHVISAVEPVDHLPKDSLLVWTASVPQILIEDEVIICEGTDYYTFNDEDKTEVLGLQQIEESWSEMVRVTTTYFPLFILLTVPFLSFMLRLTNRKGGHSRFEHFIFSLHYTAFLEMLIIFIYLIHLVAAPHVWAMQWILILGSCTYLTIALREVYEKKNWFRVAGRAILMNIGYIVILILVFIAIYIASVLMVIF